MLRGEARFGGIPHCWIVADSTNGARQATSRGFLNSRGRAMPATNRPRTPAEDAKGSAALQAALGMAQRTMAFAPEAERGEVREGGIRCCDSGESPAKNGRGDVKRDTAIPPGLTAQHIPGIQQDPMQTHTHTLRASNPKTYALCPALRAAMTYQWQLPGRWPTVLAAPGYAHRRGQRHRSGTSPRRGARGRRSRSRCSAAATSGGPAAAGTAPRPGAAAAVSLPRRVTGGR